VKPTGSVEPPAWSRDLYYALGGSLAVAEAKDPDPVGGLTSWVYKHGNKYDVTLTWKNSSYPAAATHYQVFRKPSGGSYIQLGGGNITAPPIGTDGGLTDRDLVAGVYFYKVVGVGGSPAVAGQESRVLRVDAGGTTQPAASGTAITVLPGQVRVTWNRVSNDSPDLGEPTSDFLGYRVERRAGGSGGYWERLTPLPLRETSFLDPAPPTGQVLDYNVIALDSSGVATGFTTVVSTTLATDLFRPTIPGGVFGSSGPGVGEASLGWDASPEPDVLQYKVYRWDGTNWVAQPVWYWKGVDFELVGYNLFREESPTDFVQLNATPLQFGATDVWYDAPDGDPHGYRIQMVTNNLQEMNPPAGMPSGWGVNVRGPMSAPICVGADDGEMADEVCAPNGWWGGGGDDNYPPDDAPPPRMKKIAECLEARPQDGVRLASFDLPPGGAEGSTGSTIDAQVASTPEASPGRRPVTEQVLLC